MAVLLAVATLAAVVVFAVLAVEFNTILIITVFAAPIVSCQWRDYCAVAIFITTCTHIYNYAHT